MKLLIDTFYSTNSTQLLCANRRILSALFYLGFTAFVFNDLEKMHALDILIDTKSSRNRFLFNYYKYTSMYLFIVSSTRSDKQIQQLSVFCLGLCIPESRIRIRRTNI